MVDTSKSSGSGALSDGLASSGVSSASGSRFVSAAAGWNAIVGVGGPDEACDADGESATGDDRTTREGGGEHDSAVGCGSGGESAAGEDAFAGRIHESSGGGDEGWATVRCGGVSGDRSSGGAIAFVCGGNVRGSGGADGAGKGICKAGGVGGATAMTFVLVWVGREAGRGICNGGGDGVSGTAMSFGSGGRGRCDGGR